MRVLPAFFIAAVIYAQTAIATTGTNEDSQSPEWAVAYDWLCSHGIQTVPANLKKSDEQLQDVIIFEDRRQMCFVIVLKKEHWDDVENPVVAYSTESSVRSNPPLTRYLTQLREQLHKRHRKDTTTPQQFPYKPKATAIAPLLGKLQWGQYAPYNYLAPTLLRNNKKAIIGCVPLAIAMVMNYHKWPLQGESHVYYKPDNTTYSMDYTKCKPQWDEYRSAYTSYDTLAARNLSHLLVSIAMAVDATFYENATSAQMSQVKHTLCNNLRYSGKLALRRNGLTMAECMAILYREMDAGRPTIVTDQGHCFVCDGYDGDFLHFNFGWYGSCNGYYRLHLSQSTEETIDSLQWLTNIIFGIEPEKTKKCEVILSKAGTLNEQLTVDEKENVTELVIKGPLNSSDIKLIRKMAGAEDSTYFDSWWGGSLRHLDLSEATIVNDKKPYLIQKATGSWWYVDGATKRRTEWHFSNMDLRQWRDFKSKLGVEHDGFVYSRSDDDRYWMNYYCQKNVIGEYMFADCSSLQDIQLPLSTKSIGNWAFLRCSSLQTMYVPPKVSEIGKKPFQDCLSLERVEVPSGVQTHRDGTAVNCSPFLKGIIRYKHK